MEEIGWNAGDIKVNPWGLPRECRGMQGECSGNEEECIGNEGECRGMVR